MDRKTFLLSVRILLLTKIKENKNIKKQLTELRKNIYILSCVCHMYAPFLAVISMQCVINPIFWNLRQTTRSTIMLSALMFLLDRILNVCCVLSWRIKFLFCFPYEMGQMLNLKVIYSSPWFSSTWCNYCLEFPCYKKPLLLFFI